MNTQTMHLGAFSVSLAVKDLSASRAFYEKLGFEVIAGNAEQDWLILRNGSTTIGLFHGMFDQNILTFNPQNLRMLQQELRTKGYHFELNEEAQDQSEGPSHALFADPDGNLILFDQM